MSSVVVVEVAMVVVVDSRDGSDDVDGVRDLLEKCGHGAKTTTHCGGRETVSFCLGINAVEYGRTPA